MEHLGVPDQQGELSASEFFNSSFFQDDFEPYFPDLDSQDHNLQHAENTLTNMDLLSVNCPAEIEGLINNALSLVSLATIINLE